MLVRIVLGLALIGGSGIAAAPPAHAAVPPVHPAAPVAHPAGGVGPGAVGGPAKQQAGIVIGKPILKHH
jgi:hypothetical protein